VYFSVPAAVGTAAVQKGRLGDDGLIFEGTVNFGLTHKLIPGPDGFPPTEFAPGAEGDAEYSPLVHIVANEDEKQEKTICINGPVLNAPQVANDTGRSLSVVDIDYERKTVTREGYALVNVSGVYSPCNG